MSRVQHPPQSQQDAGHIAPAIDLRRILICGAVLGAVLATALAIAVGMYAWRGRTSKVPLGPNVSGAAVATFPVPRLQPERGEERRAYLSAQRAKANEYAWIDRAQGIVRIPIERAMRLLREESTAEGHQDARQ